MSDQTDIDAIVRALYASIGFPPGGAPDYERLRKLFVPGARMYPPSDDGDLVESLELERFFEMSRRAIAGSPALSERGFHESEVARRTEAYASIAQVFSTYEARHSPDDADPMSRGINSIQLVRREGKWWVLTMAWDDESPQTPLPARYRETPR